MNKCMKEKVETTTPDTGYPAEIGYISISFTFVSNFTFITKCENSITCFPKTTHI